MSDYAAVGPRVAEGPSQFYLWLSGWMCLLAIIGFGPGYVSALVDGSWIRSIPVHLHAVVYVGWLALYTRQVSLPSAGRVADHRRFGRLLVGYFALMMVMGLLVTFSRFAEEVSAGNLAGAQAGFIHPFSDMFIFPALFGAALWFRQNPEVHKRLMVCATTFLLIAAVGRMTFLGEPPPTLLYDLVWLSPIWIAMLRDLYLERRVYAPYAICLPLLALVPLRFSVTGTAPYLDFTAWLGSVLT